MRVTDLRPALGTLLDRQYGVLSRKQLLAAGVGDMTICRHLRDGRWQRLAPAVYRVENTDGGTEHRRIAAALFAGEDCQLTGLTALHWYGFRSAPSTDRIHVLIPHHTRCRSTGFIVVQRTLALDPAARDADVYRITSAPRAVVDACRLLTTLRDVRAIVAEAVQSGRASPAQLDAEIRRAARSRTGLVRRALTEVAEGVMSAPEAELRDLTLSSNVLPAVLWNPRLTTVDGRPVPTPDGFIEEAGLALEVDSVEYHADPDGWRRTLERDRTLTLLDVEVLHVLPSEIRAFPRKVLADIETAYRNRMASGVRARVVVSSA